MRAGIGYAQQTHIGTGLHCRQRTKAYCTDGTGPFHYSWQISPQRQNLRKFPWQAGGVLHHLAKWPSLVPAPVPRYLIQ